LLLDRGHQVDWFQSGEILIYAAVAVSAAWIAIVHLATSPNPLFPRALFHDSNFVMALGFMAIVGMSMFATMALLPPMLQHLFGYSVIDTGLALTPRGVGVLIAMQISGGLVRRGTDPRLMISVGLAISGFSMLEMATWSLAVDRYHILWTGLVQGLGIGLVFIPLNTSAFASLVPTTRTDGSSLMNIMRSVGSSIGISAVMAVLARNQQVSHSDLAAHVTSSVTDLIDVTTIDRFQVVGEAALRMIDAEVNRQAMMIAFINDFYLMAWVNFAAIPLVFLMRRVRPPTIAGQQDPADLPH
jgi:MFS transporter, DHA2 family, multidrug resistance protein